MTKEVTFQIPFEGFYNSIHDFWFDEVLAQINQDDAGGEVDIISTDNVEWAAVQLAYAQAYLGKVVDATGVPMTFNRILDQKDYSMGNDRIIAAMPEEAFEKLVVDRLASKDAQSNWADCVREALTERPGYIPFTSTYSPDAGEWGSPVDWDDAQRDLFMVHVLTSKIDEAEIAEQLSEKVDDWIWKNVIDADKVPGHVDNTLEA